MGVQEVVQGSSDYGWCMFFNKAWSCGRKHVLTNETKHHRSLAVDDAFWTITSLGAVATSKLPIIVQSGLHWLIAVQLIRKLRITDDCINSTIFMKPTPADDSRHMQGDGSQHAAVTNHFLQHKQLFKQMMHACLGVEDKQHKDSTW